ncbi:MAG: response regulator [candidate division Zixibacteria bacterium]|nr:response regulator [candidate division Zixibacteria bacterium]
MKDRKNVLVIDDEPIVLDSCRRILHDEGFEVNGVMDGREGLKKIEEDKYDAVLVDWKLPEIDGMEVLRIIKKNHPDIIVVMITGYPSVESAVKAMKLGVSDYVSKPFTPEELKEALVNALAHSERPKKEEPEVKSAIEAEAKRIIAGTEEKPETEVEEPKPKTLIREELFPETLAISGTKRLVNVILSIPRFLWSAVFSRLFFILLLPVGLVTIIAGIFKTIFGKKSLR